MNLAFSVERLGQGAIRSVHKGITTKVVMILLFSGSFCLIKKAREYYINIWHLDLSPNSLLPS